MPGKPWTAPAERSGDGALGKGENGSARERKSPRSALPKAVSPLRSATALHTNNSFVTDFCRSHAFIRVDLCSSVVKKFLPVNYLQNGDAEKWTVPQLSQRGLLEFLSPLQELQRDFFGFWRKFPESKNVEMSLEPVLNFFAEKNVQSKYNPAISWG